MSRNRHANESSRRNKRKALNASERALMDPTKFQLAGAQFDGKLLMEALST